MLCSSCVVGVCERQTFLEIIGVHIEFLAICGPKPSCGRNFKELLEKTHMPRKVSGAPIVLRT